MNYEVIFTKKAVKDLDGLDSQTKLQIIEKIKYFSREPLKFARKLIEPLIGQYRFRIGDYRVIFDIDNEKLVVLRIGHRKNIYN